MYDVKSKVKIQPLPEGLTLQAIDIYHVYGLEHQNKVVALRGISFDINKGGKGQPFFRKSSRL